MENKIKFLIIPILIIALLFPNLAFADIFGIMDYVESALNAIEEFTGVPMTFWVRIFLYYVIGLIVFTTSGSLLNWILRAPLESYSLITLHNEFVQKGWMFVSGLVNMGIILILLMIAFAYILKIETFEAKKTFVRLIIIALLINFSLVFVQALFDISNIIYNAILNIVGINIVVDAFNVLFQGIWGFILTMGGSILLAASSLLIPFANIFVQFGILVTWLVSGYLFLPTMILQIVIAFLFSFIFLLFFLLFTFRIFIIWILAVLSPLAFVCFVLPQTKKHWDEWLKYLLEWMFVGIFALFFLALGLKTIPSIPQPTALWGGFILVPGWFYYYFFLLIYLLLVIWLLIKSMPTFAQFLIDNTKAVGGMVWTKGIKPLGGAVAKGAAEATVKQGELEERAAKGEKLSRAERLSLTPLGKVPAGVTRWAYRVGGVTPEFVVAKRLEEETGKIEKKYGKDIDTAVAAYSRATPEMKAALGLYLAKMKGAKGIDKLDLEKQRETVELISRLAPKKLEDFIKHKPELFDDEKVGELVQGTMVSKGLEDEDAKKLMEIGISPADAIRKAAFKKAVDAMKVADIENLGIKTVENKNFQEMVVRFKDVNFIRRIGEEKGTEYIEMIREKARELKAEEVAKTNLSLLRQSVVNPGFRAVFPPIEGATTSEEVEILGEKIKEERKRKPPTPLIPPTPPPPTPPPGRPPYGPAGRPGVSRRRPPGRP